MIVSIAENTYDMPVKVFDNMVELITEQNSSRYFIYCVVKSNIFMMVKDYFDIKEEFLPSLLRYIDEGFDVYFVEEGVKCVEYAQ